MRSSALLFALAATLLPASLWAQAEPRPAKPRPAAPELRGPAAILFLPPGQPIQTATTVLELPIEPALPPTLPPIVAPPVAIIPEAPSKKLVQGDAAFPFLGQDSEALIASTDVMLKQLTPLIIPPIDLDLLQFGSSFSLSGGTGSLPGATGEVARCGVLATWRNGSTVPPPNIRELCCVFDAPTQSFRCGDPAAFPVKDRGLELARSPNPDLSEVSTLLHCDNLDADTAASPPHGIPTTYPDGSALGAGDVCCLYRGSSPESDPLSCAPGLVSGGSSVGSDAAGQFQLRTEVYGEGLFSIFEERRDYAYNIEVAGRLSLINEVRAAGNDAHSFRARFSRLSGGYKRFLEAGPSPWFVGGGADLNGLTVEFRKLGDLDLEVLHDIPGHLTLKGGFGRIYDIEPRIKLRKLEAMLMRHGLITSPISHEVAREIMIAWWVLRSEVGFDQRLLYTFKILRDRGLLIGPITASVTYRFGQILGDPQLVRRQQGHDTRLILRFGTRFREGQNETFTFVAEARDDRIYNLGYDTEVFWAPALALAPRSEDQRDNTLPDADLPAFGFRQGLLAASVPVGVRLYRYDNFMNKLGATELRARLALAYAKPGKLGAPQGLSLALGARAAYTLFESAFSGWQFQVEGDVGLVDEELVYSLIGGIAIVFGTGESYFVAPGPVIDALPFDLPLPAFL